MSGMQREYDFLVGVGGIGSGMFFGLRGDRTLGRNESRAGEILRRRDFCKLHIITQYVAVLMRSADGDFPVLPIGKVGDDPPGRTLVECMRDVGMDTRFVAVEPEYPTLFSVCFTYPDGDGGNITTDDSASAHVAPADVEGAVTALGDVLARGGVEGRGIALAAPEVPLATRRRLLELARANEWLGAASFTSGEVAPAMDMGLFGLVDLLSINRDEAAAVAGVNSGERIESVATAAAEKLTAIHPDMHICITAGADGAFGFANGQMEYCPACPVKVVNTAGAGDAMLGALMVAAAEGLPFIRSGRARRERLMDAPLASALDLATLVAGLAVQSEDTINFDADAAAIERLAAEMNADMGPLKATLGWE